MKMPKASDTDKHRFRTLIETVDHIPGVEVKPMFGQLGAFVNGNMFAGLFGWLPGAPLSWDQWLMLQNDNIVSGRHAGLRAFGITPTPLAAVSAGWLTAYRQHGRFAAKQPY